jgi:hypothetical protein
MEEPMRKTKKQKRPKSTDTLLKTSKKKDIELTENELGKVSGGSGSQPKQNTRLFMDAVAGDLSATVKFKY